MACQQGDSHTKSNHDTQSVYQAHTTQPNVGDMMTGFDESSAQLCRCGPIRNTFKLGNLLCSNRLWLRVVLKYLDYQVTLTASSLKLKKKKKTPSHDASSLLLIMNRDAEIDELIKVSQLTSRSLVCNGIVIIALKWTTVNISYSKTKHIHVKHLHSIKTRRHDAASGHLLSFMYYCYINSD